MFYTTSHVFSTADRFPAVSGVDTLENTPNLMLVLNRNCSLRIGIGTDLTADLSLLADDAVICTIIHGCRWHKASDLTSLHRAISTLRNRRKKMGRRISICNTNWLNNMQTQSALPTPTAHICKHSYEVCCMLLLYAICHTL